MLQKAEGLAAGPIHSARDRKLTFSDMLALRAAGMISIIFLKLLPVRSAAKRAAAFAMSQRTVRRLCASFRDPSSTGSGEIAP